jgi:hypothetical protein
MRSFPPDDPFDEPRGRRARRLLLHKAVLRRRAPCRVCCVPLDDEHRCACGLAFCPFCSAVAWERCEHLLASEDGLGGFDVSPFDRPVPRLPDGDWAAALGDLAPLLGAYRDGEAWLPDLLAQIARRITTPVLSLFSSNATSMVCGGWHDHFSPDPAAARAEINGLLARFAERLAQTE